MPRLPSVENLFDDAGLMRFAVFAGLFVLLVLLEQLFPRRSRTQPRRQRWVTNGALIVIDTLALRLILPVAALGMAGIAEARGWGLFNMIDWPEWLEIILCVVILDMAIYWQHVATHRVPLLWRLHKVHHVDRDLDATSGFRFHPLEIVGSMIFKIALVALLGPAIVAVFIFELLLNAGSMFSHANLRLPLRLDQALRLALVTPDMHRIHHSTREHETNTNYGFSTSAWDRLFGTYRDDPQDGHERMTIGLDEYQDERPARLLPSLAIPFARSRPNAPNRK